MVRARGLLGEIVGQWLLDFSEAIEKLRYSICAVR